MWHLEAGVRQVQRPRHAPCSRLPKRQQPGLEKPWWVKPVAANVRAMPRGRKGAMTAPMIATASTPPFIKLAGSSSLPFRPTARLIQTRMKAAATVTPAAARYGVLPVILAVSSMVSQAATSMAPKRAKSAASHFTSSVPSSHGFRVVCYRSPYFLPLPCLYAGTDSGLWLGYKSQISTTSSPSKFGEEPIL